MKLQFNFYFLVIAFLSLLFFGACQQSKPIDFNTQIKPIINEKCISCHGGVKKNAGLSFLFEKDALGATKEGSPAIIPGNSKKSRMIQRLHETDLELRMPYEKPPLSKEEIELFTQWIDQGAKWGTHWAYIPPKKEELPEVDSSFKKGGFLQRPSTILSPLEWKRESCNRMKRLPLTFSLADSRLTLQGFLLNEPFLRPLCKKKSPMKII